MQGAGCRVWGARCRVQGAGCRVQGAGCRVQGVGCKDLVDGRMRIVRLLQPLRLFSKRRRDLQVTSLKALNLFLPGKGRCFRF